MAPDYTSLPTKTGTIPFHHPSLPPDKPCSTWYKIVGDLSSSPTSVPLVTLHGGPGACHNYLLPLRHLTLTHSIPIVFYDQLGNGNSTHLREKRLDTDFWTPDLFMSELENLLSNLGIKEYDLLGQSWGGMLASMWACRKPQGLRRLIISNSPSSMKLWVDSCNYWRTLLPEGVEGAIAKHERERDYESEEYKEVSSAPRGFHLVFMLVKDMMGLLDGELTEWIGRVVLLQTPPLPCQRFGQTA
jgi:proline-specific peptidase